MTYPSAAGSFVQTGHPGTDLIDQVERLAATIRADTDALDCAIRLNPHHPALSALTPPQSVRPSPQVETSDLGLLCQGLIDQATAHPTTMPRWRFTMHPIPTRRGILPCRVIVAELRLATQVFAAIGLAAPSGATAPGSRLSEAKRRLVETTLTAFVQRARLDADLLARSGRWGPPVAPAPHPLTPAVIDAQEFRRVAAAQLTKTTGSAAVVVLGIDRFKLVLDVFGADFRDRLVASLAQSLRHLTPPETLLGRIERDSFALLLPLASHAPQDLETALSHIRLAIQQATAALGKPDLGRISLGAALFPDHATEVDVLLDQAMDARTSAQRSGRSGYHIFAPHKRPRLSHPQIPERFAQALRDNRIVPYFQPTADLVTGDLLGFELLTRWFDQERGVISAQDFAGVFSDFRAAASLTHTVIQIAFPLWRRFLNARRVSDPAPRLAINMTTFDLMNPEFVFDLQAALVDHGLDWSTITAEVTENIILGDDQSQVFRSLREMQRRGALIALDDFGTGYAGLSHLSQWPVDILKIDRSFVQSLNQSPAHTAIVDAMIGIGQACGIGVIAEGVETPEQLRTLQRLGCRLGQGHLFSCALNPVELATAPRWFDAIRTGTPHPHVENTRDIWQNHSRHS